MVIALHLLTSFNTTFFSLHCSSKRNRHGKQRKRRQFRQNHSQSIVTDNKNSNTVLPFRTPSPTPLFINNRPETQTPLQSLDAVVSDLESSVEKGVQIEPEIFASLLETCFRLKSIDHGIRIHRFIPPRLLRKNSGVSSKLLRLYASCGNVETAHELFDQMSKRNDSAFAWNSLISGYTELGHYEDALALYFQMEEEGVSPDQFTFPRVLKACAGIGSVRIGEAVHRDLVRYGFGNDGVVFNALVDMYTKCGDIAKARIIFDKIACRDTVSWNSMLAGYFRHGLVTQAIEVLQMMVQEKVELDSVSISTILSGVSSLELGLQIHGWVLRREMDLDLSVANALIVFYANHGQLNRVCSLFDAMPEKDIVSWNSIISAHSTDSEALKYFYQMDSSSVVPDSITFVSVLSACAHSGLVTEGEFLFSMMKHRHGIKAAMEHYACMVNLYGRAGLISEAYSLIVDKMEFEAGPTVWGALLYACYLHGNVDIGEIAAKNLFELEPDNEHNFELSMKIYRKAKRFQDVERVRKMKEDRGL